MHVLFTVRNVINYLPHEQISGTPTYMAKVPLYYYYYYYYYFYYFYYFYYYYFYYFYFYSVTR